VKSALIWGGGFIAKSLAAALAPTNNVSVVTRRSVSFSKIVRGPRVYFSLADCIDSGFRPNIVVFCTGPSSTSMDEKSGERFSRELVEALNFSAATSVDQFIYISSGGGVYLPSDKPLLESSRVDLKSDYARYQLNCERLVRSVSGIKSRICFRLGNPFGKYQNPIRSVGFVSMAMRCAKFQAPLTVIGNGLIYRDFFHIDLLSTVLMSKKIESFTGFEVCNFGSGRSVSLMEIVGLIQAISGLKVDITHDLNVTAYRPVLRLDVSKFRDMFGFFELSDIDYGLRLLFEEWSGLTESHIDAF
jgi:nucleoside-diphosphate-sugar epimerase